MKRVLVAANSSVVRAGLESLISASPALTVVGSVPGVAGESFARVLADLRPDVALVELAERTDATWNELLALLHGGEETHPQPPFFVLLSDAVGEAGDADSGWAVDALRAGVRALLPRDAAGDEITAAVEAAAAGLITLAPSILDALTAALPATTRAAGASDRTSRTDALLEPLTPRELEVLRLLAEGLGNRALAARLGISEHTIKFHLSAIFAKLGATSRTEAVNLAIRRGLVLL